MNDITRETKEYALDIIPPAAQTAMEIDEQPYPAQFEMCAEAVRGPKGDKGDKGEKGDPGESGVTFRPDHTLRLEDGILSVNTTDAVEKDNTLPITSAAVYSEVGNIEILLKTI